MPMSQPTRSDVEDFLILEADLLDEWRLPEWLELFTEDATYCVPATDLPSDASPDTSLFYVADDVLPQTIEVVQTRAKPAGIEVKVGPAADAATAGAALVTRRAARRRVDAARDRDVARDHC